MPQIFKNLKSLPYLRKLFFFFVCILNQNKKSIIGSSNKIHIDTQGTFPKLKNVVIKIYGNENNIIIKQGVKLLNSKIEIHGSCHQLIIEDYCHIQGSYLWMEDNDGLLKIGRGTSFEKEVKICVTEANSQINIGENCMLAYGIVIRSGDSHSIIDLESNQRINYAENININNHVWIGTNAQVLKGSNIGSNSIIAAGAIVTKNIPENCIAAGVPAKVKKEKVTWVREKIIRTLN
ncbi:acyltransferase [Nostoc sp. FACHB-190]|uniref:acyltransferase n=1 Tax=Nostoc sp. FACHB-190 TaxID=2692838 RepID=UPI0016849721|nr:acyltransferase [Nostoc sp. FACHB-190]MBD2297304.1 acyltransferase [Nostoc sp. FACHB-190]